MSVLHSLVSGLGYGLVAGFLYAFVFGILFAEAMSASSSLSGMPSSSRNVNDTSAIVMLLAMFVAVPLGALSGALTTFMLNMVFRSLPALRNRHTLVSVALCAIVYLVVLIPALVYSIGDGDYQVLVEVTDWSSWAAIFVLPGLFYVATGALWTRWHMNYWLPESAQ